MTVQELIDKLQQVEDKSLPVGYNDQCSDGGPWHILEIAPASCKREPHPNMKLGPWDIPDGEFILLM